MVLILIGLYSFLWGKGKETQCLPQESEEIATSMAAESVGLHSTAIIVPSSSPNNATLGDEKTTKTEK